MTARKAEWMGVLGQLRAEVGEDAFRSWLQPMNLEHVDSEQAVIAALESQRAVSKIKVEGYRPKQRAGVHRGTPRKVKGDFLGVDVNIAARVGDCAEGGEVLISEPVRDQLDGRRFRFGKARPLDAPGAPPDLTVCAVKAKRRRQ